MSDRKEQRQRNLRRVVLCNVLQDRTQAIRILVAEHLGEWPDPDCLYSYIGVHHDKLVDECYVFTTNTIQYETVCHFDEFEDMVRVLFGEYKEKKGRYSSFKQYLETIRDNDGAVEMENEKKNGHVHAEAMAQYAEDAKKTDEPWLLWEVNVCNSWIELEKNPCWVNSNQYRRKRSTVTVDITDCHPVSEPLEFGTKYFAPAILESKYVELVWFGNQLDHDLFEAGRVHLTKESALAQCEAFLQISKTKK